MSRSRYIDNYYETLGVDLSATYIEIRKAYLALRKEWFHDKFINAADSEKKKAHDMSAKINEAYEVLKDSNKRFFYNRDYFPKGEFIGRKPPQAEPPLPPDEPSTAAESVVADIKPKPVGLPVKITGIKHGYQSFEGPVIVAGILKGNLTTKSSVEVTGTVEGSIIADDKVTVHGKVTGSVTSKNAAIFGTDNVIGVCTSHAASHAQPTQKHSRA